MATLLIVFTLNLLGISLVNRVNFIVIALSVLLVVVLMVLAFKKTLRGDTLVRLLEPFTFGQRGIGGIASGAAILSLWFLGFVAVSTLAEEARNTRRDIPRAIVGSTLLGGLLFVLVSWSGALAWSPNWQALSADEVEAVGVSLVRVLGGAPFAAFFIAIYVVSCFGSAMTGQASVSRARRCAAPAAHQAAPRFSTPFVVVIVVSVFALASLVLDLNTAEFMISFGALAAFAMVNLSAIKDEFLRKDRTGNRAKGGVLLHLVCPLIGFALTVWPDSRQVSA